jgi:4-hydroxymandelate oxidase
MTTDVAPQQPTAEPVNLADFEALARQRISSMAWAYLCGAAGDELTLQWNREAFSRIRLKPRVLVDVSRLDTRIELLGQELPLPILLAPVAYHRLFHPEGETATARGAGAAGATMIVSTAATTAIEDIAAAATRPLWFQLYIQRDRGFTRALVERAQAAGCRALCLTVDTPVAGARDREAKARFTLPPGIHLPNLEGISLPRDPHRPNEGDIYSALLAPDVTWKDVEWLLSFSKIPVVLKGILNADDADRAVKAGAAGLIVSNHGARNLDTAPPTIEALPHIIQRVAGRVPVLLDGGIRRGTDVLKALALGARAVLIGRPYLFGLAVGGAEGISRVVNILLNELQMAMALTGRPTVASLDRSVLWPEKSSR